MRTKVVIGLFISVSVLLLLPSIPAVEYNTFEQYAGQSLGEYLQSDAVQQWKQQIASLSDEEREELIQQTMDALEEALDQPSIDIELILIILFQLLAMKFTGKVTLSSIISIGLYAFSVINEYNSGESDEKDPSVHIAFFGSFYLMVTSFIYSKIPSEKLGSVFLFLTSLLYTFLIGPLLQSQFVTEES